MIGKRNRSINWNEEEKKLFLNVLRDYVHIVEEKSFNTTSNKTKNKAWEEIHKKKTFNSYAKQINKPGGGKRPATVDESIFEVRHLLKSAELTRDHNTYDSDGHDLTKPMINKHEQPELGAFSEANICENQDLTKPADEVSFESSQEDKQTSHITNTPLSKVTPKTPKQQKVLRIAKPENNRKVYEYVNHMVKYTNNLKHQEHKRRMEMAEEEHGINMQIQKEKLKCVILEKEILEFKKSSLNFSS